MKKILILGGTGYIGKSLRNFFINQAHLSVSSRKYKSITKQEKTIFYPLSALSTAIDKNEIIINLVGENIIKQAWTQKRKKKLLTSRVDFTAKVVQLLQKTKKKKLLLNASAIGYYGNLINQKDNPLTEKHQLKTHIRKKNFIANLCFEWEKKTEALKKKPSIQVLLLRIGLVLDSQQGILKRILQTYKLFLGGPIGKGKDAFTWIALKEIPLIINFLIKKSYKIKGAVNLVSPQMLSQDDFSKKVSQKLKVTNFFRIPSFILKFLLGERSNLILNTPFIKPAKLLKNGYQFQYEEIESVIK